MKRVALALLVIAALDARAGRIDFSLTEERFPFVDAWLGEFSDELGEAMIFGEAPKYNILAPGDKAAVGAHDKTWRLYTTAAKFYDANRDFLESGTRLENAGRLDALGWRVKRMNGLPNLEAHPRIHHAVWQSRDGRRALFLANVSWADSDWRWTGYGKSFAERLPKYSYAVIPLWDVPDAVNVGAPKRIKAVPYTNGGPRYPSATWDFEKADWTPFDRLVIDVVSHGEGGDKLMLYVKDSWTRNRQDDWVLDTFTPGEYGVYRWVVSFASGRETTCVLRSVKQLHVFAGSPDHPDYEIASVRLVRRGAQLPPALDAPAGVANIRAAREAELAAERIRSMDGMLAVGAMRIGLATSMEKIRPDRPLPGPCPLNSGGKAKLSLARNEHEALQVLIGNAGSVPIKAARVAVLDLKCAGNVLAATNISVGVAGYVHTAGVPRYRVGYNVSTNAAPGYRRLVKKAEPGWYPDPILDFLDCADVRPSFVQSFWVDVKCPEGQAAGTYAGSILVSAGKGRQVAIPFEVEVWGFSIPKTSPMPLAVSFWVDGSSPCRKLVDGRLDEWADFLADHFITIDSLYLAGSPRWEQLVRLKNQGRLNRFELSMWGDFKRSSEAERDWMESMNSGKPRLDAAYQKAKELGLLDHAYIYGMDEQPTNRFPAMKASLPLLKKWYPGVPIMTTCFDYTYGEDGMLSDVDVFIPDTTKYDLAKANAARAHGRHVWWYLACTPHAPYANFFVECEAIEARSLMGVQAIKYRPEGFLYYSIGAWRKNMPVTDGPFTSWDPLSWGSPGNEYHGDGSWTIPGPDGRPLETVRLYNFRDGLEDYAYAKLLFERTGKWPEIPDSIVESVTNYNSSASVHYRWRDDLAARIESAK